MAQPGNPGLLECQADPELMARQARKALLAWTLSEISARLSPIRVTKVTEACLASGVQRATKDHR